MTKFERDKVYKTQDGWVETSDWFGLFATRRQCMACMGIGRNPVLVNFAGCEPGTIAGVPDNFMPGYDMVLYSRPVSARSDMIRMLDDPAWQESLAAAPNAALVEVMQRPAPWEEPKTSAKLYPVPHCAACHDYEICSAMRQCMQLAQPGFWTHRR